MIIELQPDEKELAVVRKHWFLFLARGLSIFFAAILPFVLFAILAAVNSQASFILFSDNAGNLLFILYVAWLIILWITLFSMWTTYYLDMIILTDKKVIRVEQPALFSREISATRLDRLQDITVDVSGLLQTFLNFGTIRIQTAGEAEEFLVHGIPHPYDVKNKILEASQKQIEQWKNPPSVTPLGG